MKTLLLLHHSHTDIGYTNPQFRVRRHQIDYIRQVLRLLQRRGPDCGFRWNCESFWVVEQFLAEAGDEDRARFADAVRAGAIGLSASYANFSELLDEESLGALTGRAAAYGDSIGCGVRSAMTADINGFGWGFVTALRDAGCENLFTCIHTHHGMFPLERHRPFRWQGPGGAEILVWNGEHYHLGNELGLAPGAVSSYLTKDDCDAHAVHHDPWLVAERRIPRLFARLEEEGYPYDFLPVMISGLRCDNAPPNEAILDQVERWNAAHGREIRAEMATLDGFFERLRAEPRAIPVHRGDWPDWWTDGAASMPAATARLRRAQRIRGAARRLRDAAGPLDADTAARLDETDRRTLDDLALYAEHTYGHAASIVQPHDEMVRALAARKEAWASTALESAEDLLDRTTAALGRIEHGTGAPLRWTVVNPHPCRVTDAARLCVEHHEYYERWVYQGIRVVDEATGAALPAGVDPTPVTTTVLVPLALAPGERRTLRIEPVRGRDLTPDRGRPELAVDELATEQGSFTTEAFRIDWRRPAGITAWLSRPGGADLLRRDRLHGAFQPVAAVTPLPDRRDAWSVRGALGLSRNGADAAWSAAQVTAVREYRSGVAPGDPLVDAREDTDTPMFRRLEFDLRLDGCDGGSLAVEALAGRPQIDVVLRVNKQNRLDPENLYLSLPFGAGSHTGIVLDRTGGAVRARVDQLPGTLVDYYALQGGFLAGLNEGFVPIALRDAALLQLGPLGYLDERPRHEATNPTPDAALPYAWLMTNCWETNFAAGLGGFHEFRFTVHPPARGDDVDGAIERLRAGNAGLVCFRIDER